MEIHTIDSNYGDFEFKRKLFNYVILQFESFLSGIEYCYALKIANYLHDKYDTIHVFYINDDDSELNMFTNIKIKPSHVISSNLDNVYLRYREAYPEKRINLTNFARRIKSLGISLRYFSDFAKNYDLDHPVFQTIHKINNLDPSYWVV